MTGFGNTKQNKKRTNQEKILQKEETLKSAISTYQKGDLISAKILLEKIIQANPKDSFALGFLATIEKAIGNKERALKLFEMSTSINQNDPDILHNYSGLLEGKDLEKALKISNRAVSFSPNNSRYLERNGYLKWKHQDLRGALDATTKALELSPNLIDAHINLGGIYKDLGELEQALASTLKSLVLKPDNPDAHINMGSIYQDLGKFEQALASTHKSLTLKPDNPDALFNLGNIYNEIGNFEQALTCNLKSLELKPDNPDAHMNLGSIYQDLGNIDQALASTLKSLELNPDNPKALINLGGIYKSLGKIKNAKAAVSQALIATKNDSPTITMILHFYDSTNEEDLLEKAINFLKPTIGDSSLRISMYEARALFRKNNYKEGWAKISTLNSKSIEANDWFSKSKLYAFRAEIAEKIKHYDEAFISFAMSQIDPKYKLLNHKEEHVRIQKYIALSREMAQNPSHDNSSNQTKNNTAPIFLIGFPRSGTTLLDIVLRSHPGIEVLEEKDSLFQTENAGKNKLHRQVSDFSLLKEDELNMLRDIYHARTQSHSKEKGKLIIDKLPLHTIAVPLINLLFPNAKIIFAVRHPCDSILSCFQQTFQPNAAMANFTTLEKSVDFYDEVMHGWVNYNKYLKINHITTKYEDLIENFHENMSKIFNYLELDWDDAVNDYREMAENRELINTPSASQVVQPLYKSSMYRWENYKKHFSTHMERLNPWINYFGYQKRQTL